MNKKIILILSIVVIIILIFLFVLAYKIKNNGNNIINKSSEELLEYMFNVNSYEATIEVTINSNKTTNNYEMKQYFLLPNYSKQVIIGPENIKGVETIYDGKNLKINNNNLELIKTYENYSYINNNILWLNYILKEISDNYSIEEKEDKIAILGNLQAYNYKVTLYIDKESNLPVEVNITDNNNKDKIFIKYKEIKLNNIRENNIFE